MAETPHRHTRRHVLAGLACAGCSTALGGCLGTNPATGRQSFTGLMSVEDDAALGAQEHPKMLEAFGGEYENQRLAGYVNEIGRRLAQFSEFHQFNYRFTILNTPVVNAFALPGGFVYISRGLLALASSEAEVAGVLAHEIGHVTARHSAERIGAQQLAQIGLIGAALLGVDSSLLDIGQSIAGLAIRGYSRSQELEADTLGVRYMSQAGYDPDAMVTFLATLGEHSRLEGQMLGLPEGQEDQYNIMSTHPRTADRVRQAQAAANARRPANPIVGRDGYLGQIDGMTFGDDPKQGLVLGQRFVHPELRFEFSVPDSFVLRNRPDSVQAVHPGGAAIVFDIGRRGREPLPAYLQQRWARRVPLRQLERIEVNGREAATATAVGRGKDGLVDYRFLAIAGDGAQVYRFIYITPRNLTGPLNEDLRRSTYSFHTLSAEQAAGINAMRLIIVRSRPDDTVAGLARTLPFGRFNEPWFRVLNDLQPGQPLPIDRLTKVVAR